MGQPTIDTTSEAFIARLASLLRTARSDRGESVRAVARRSGGAVSARKLRAIESAELGLDDVDLPLVAGLYGVDLFALLQDRVPLEVDAAGGVLTTAGITRSFTPGVEDELLTAYLLLVRDMRDIPHEPTVALRREDVELLASHLRKDATAVLSRLGELMGATVTQRRSMVAAFAAGAALIVLTTSAVALEPGTYQQPVDSDQDGETVSALTLSSEEVDEFTPDGLDLPPAGGSPSGAAGSAGISDGGGSGGGIGDAGTDAPGAVGGSDAEVGDSGGGTDPGTGVGDPAPEDEGANDGGASGGGAPDGGSGDQGGSDEGPADDGSTAGDGGPGGSAGGGAPGDDGPSGGDGGSDGDGVSGGADGTGSQEGSDGPDASGDSGGQGGSGGEGGAGSDEGPGNSGGAGNSGDAGGPGGDGTPGNSGNGDAGGGGGSGGQRAAGDPGRAGNPGDQGNAGNQSGNDASGSDGSDSPGNSDHADGSDGVGEPGNSGNENAGGGGSSGRNT